METTSLPLSEVVIRADEWLAPEADLLTFDRRVHGAEDALRGSPSLRVLGEAGSQTKARAEAQIALRYQRLTPRRNEASRAPVFDHVLAQHKALHPLEKPLVRADFEHAIDVWQWLLRVAPDASLPLQIAALFHDIERLASEADVRVEHKAENYLAFKQQHARTGAQMLRACLSGVGLSEELLQRAESLVARHEQPENDLDLKSLNDADCLSFFALNSPGFLRYYGPEHTAKKVAYTLNRMSERARSFLPSLRLMPAIAQAIAQHEAQHTQVA